MIRTNEMESNSKEIKNPRIQIKSRALAKSIARLLKAIENTDPVTQIMLIKKDSRCRVIFCTPVPDEVHDVILVSAMHVINLEAFPAKEVKYQIEKSIRFTVDSKIAKHYDNFVYCADGNFTIEIDFKNMNIIFAEDSD